MSKSSAIVISLLLASSVLGACAIPSSPDTEPALSTSTPAQDQTMTPASPSVLSYVIVDTGQTGCYSNTGEIPCPEQGQSFFGQDAQYQGDQPAYRDNGDGTLTDLNTGLMWVQERGSKVTWDAAMSGASASRIGGYSDWRMPKIKELYSLINFNGGFHITQAASKPYIDTNYFDFKYGNESAGERLIDCQDWSATEYASTTMNGDATVFGVNFADGRIKGYGKSDPRSGGQKVLYVRYVRGNPDYGTNQFVDNSDGTITDKATGLMWQQADSGSTHNWQGALAYAEGLVVADYNDWRLPDAKELQSIVDYTRAPTVTHSAAINPIFSVSAIESYFWTGTTHLDGPPDRQGSQAVYVAFGRAMGYMQFPPDNPNRQFLDVHGAGAQRSDPKAGNPADFPYGRGPQGDEIRIYNYVRCVRDATT